MVGDPRSRAYLFGGLLGFFVIWMGSGYLLFETDVPPIVGIGGAVLAWLIFLGSINEAFR